jgi:chaperonin GroES
MAIDTTKAHQHDNLASLLDDEKLADIGSQLMGDIEADLSSRNGWEKKHEQWLKLAEQVVEGKSNPWPNAANIKYPALSKAAIQFHARAFPALLGNRAIAKGKVIGVPTEDKVASAVKVGTFMSVQCIDFIPDWMDEMDRMLMVLPITGMIFKKVWFDVIDGSVRSDIILARDLIVNYWSNDYKTARKTHRMWMSRNALVGNINQGLFTDISLDTPTEELKLPESSTERYPGVRDDIHDLTPGPGQDPDTPYEVYECHCYLDLDEDGYREPYIVTILKQSSEVLRIVPRWDEQRGMRRGITGKIYHIEPEEYFVCYKFFPDPESKIYGVGFGSLIGPTGHAINTLINQLLDSGTLSNLQSGFLGRGARVNKGGVVKFRPGEWKYVHTATDDLRKAIFPMPVREPSKVLFELLALLVESTQDLSSVQDMMMGKNPGQNQPYSTSREVLEQGMKVFNGIYKRVYRGMTRELELLYKNNHYNLSEDVYAGVLGDPEASARKDFDLNTVRIVPTAEPDMISEQDKMLKAESLIAKRAAGIPLNIGEVTRRVLEAEGHEGIEVLMDVQPQRDPNIVLEEQKLEYQKEKDLRQHRLDYLKIRDAAFKDRALAISTIKKIELEEGKFEMEAIMNDLEAIFKDRELNLTEMELEVKKIAAQKPDPKPTKSE